MRGDGWDKLDGGRAGMEIKSTSTGGDGRSFSPRARSLYIAAVAG